MNVARPVIGFALAIVGARPNAPPSTRGGRPGRAIPKPTPQGLSVGLSVGFSERTTPVTVIADARPQATQDDPRVVPFPRRMASDRRIVAALGRAEAGERRLAAQVAILSDLSDQLDALADSLEHALARLDDTVQVLAEEQDRSRAFHDEIRRLEQLVADGRLDAAEAGYRALKQAHAAPALRLLPGV